MRPGRKRPAQATAGVKRQYMGCAGRVANGINTVHLSYVREKTGHALIGARQWIPAEQIEDPVKSLVMGLPLDLQFRTKGQLAIDICADAYADGLRFDFVCGDEVYGTCTQLREFFEARGQAYVLRVAVELHASRWPAGTKLTCAEAASRLLKRQAALGGPLRREGLQGRALVRLGLARHRHPAALPADPPPPEDRRAGLPLLLRARRASSLTKTRLIRAAGLRWPVEEDFEFGKDCFGLDQCQVRLYTAIARHAVLVMAALAICAVTAALLKDRTGTQAPPPGPARPAAARRARDDPADRPGDQAPARRSPRRPDPPAHAGHWLDWRRRHQARSRWFHQRARLARDTEIALVS